MTLCSAFSGVPISEVRRYCKRVTASHHCVWGVCCTAPDYWDTWSCHSRRKLHPCFWVRLSGSGLSAVFEFPCPVHLFSQRSLLAPIHLENSTFRLSTKPCCPPPPPDKERPFWTPPAMADTCSLHFSRVYFLCQPWKILISLVPKMV